MRLLGYYWPSSKAAQGYIDPLQVSGFGVSDSGMVLIQGVCSGFSCGRGAISLCCVFDAFLYEHVNMVINKLVCLVKTNDHAVWGCNFKWKL